MASLLVRNKETRSPTPHTSSMWDPFQRMRELLRFDPLQELGLSLPTSATPTTFLPAFEVKENKDAYVFKADLPGLQEKDLDITLTGDRLVISGRREAEKEDKGDTYYAYECSYGTFQRAFTLPTGVDVEHAHAELKDGVLTMLLPKLPEAQTRKIAIQAERPKV